MKLTKTIRPLIHKTVDLVFKSYMKELLEEPIAFIVPAVWGAKKNGELDVTQQEIHRQITPVIQETIEALHLEGLSLSQEFTIGFLIREAIISKIVFLIELAKNQAVNKINFRAYA